MDSATSGRRIPVTAYLATTQWAGFHIDLVGSDVRMTGVPEDVPALARVAMPDVEQHGYRAYPLVDHIAAIFQRYGRKQVPSTRFRDLVDLVAITTSASVPADAQMAALRSEFGRRGIPVPARLDVPDTALWERVPKRPCRGQDVSQPRLRRGQPDLRPIVHLADRKNSAMANTDEVHVALRELQRLVRRPTPETATPVVHIPAGDPTPTGTPAIGLVEDEAAAAGRVRSLLEADPRYEHIANAKDAVERFIVSCFHDRQSDHVNRFIREHAKDPEIQTCFIPVARLIVKHEIEIFGIRLLPPDSSELPIAPGPHIKCIAAATAEGTNPQLMADRAREVAEHALRRLRVALRADKWVHDWQLRFRLDPTFLLSGGASGWIAPGDTSWELELSEGIIATAEAQAIAGLAAESPTDLDERANLALRWIEAAYLSADPVAAALDLFFALEAILGRKSDKEKGHGLALRRAVLSAAVSGGFSHPTRIYLLYDEVRSAAVHGEIPPPVTSEQVQKLEWDVRGALNEALGFARQHGIVTRRTLLKRLEAHPERNNVVKWLQDNGGPQWSQYLAILPQAPDH
jgi:hypothetical protein